MHRHHGNEKPQEPQGDTTDGWPTNVPNTFFTKTDRKDQADPQDHEETDNRQVGRPMRGGVPRNQGNDQQPPDHE